MSKGLCHEVAFFKLYHGFKQKAHYLGMTFFILNRIISHFWFASILVLLQDSGQLFKKLIFLHGKLSQKGTHISSTTIESDGVWTNSQDGRSTRTHSIGPALVILVKWKPENKQGKESIFEKIQIIPRNRIFQPIAR